MVECFAKAQRTIRQGNASLSVIAVNGCCYGRENNPDKGSYFKFCGQEFWELISGDKNFHQRIIQPLGHGAKLHSDDFNRGYANLVSKLTDEFSSEFCNSNGEIDWSKLVEFNSGKQPR